MRHHFDQVRHAITRRAFAALNRAVLPAVRAGAGSPWPVGAGIVVLETTGRVTGEPRHVPLLATRLGDRVQVSTVRGRSQWARNLAANPDAAVWVGGRRRVATGTVHTDGLTTAALRLQPV